MSVEASHPLFQARLRTAYDAPPSSSTRVSVTCSRATPRARSSCRMWIGGVVADSREHQRVLVPDRPFDSYAAYALEFMQALGDSRHRGRLTENLEHDHRRETMTQPGDGPNVSVKLAPDAIRGAVRALDALESSRPSGAPRSRSGPLRRQ